MHGLSMEETLLLKIYYAVKGIERRLDELEELILGSEELSPEELKELDRISQEMKEGNFVRADEL